MFDNEEAQNQNEPRGETKMLRLDRNPTITERLKQQKKEMEFRLSEINIVIEALERNPEIQEVVDAVSRIRGI